MTDKKLIRIYIVTGDFYNAIHLQKICAGLVAALLLVPGSHVNANADEPGSFQRVEMETLDGEDFVFPDDFSGASLNIVLLAISEEQDNGQWQGDRLLEWYAALDDAGVLSADVKAYHFSVMKVPWFVKGLIRGGLADDYAGKVPADQAGALFVKNIEKFAAAPGVALDGQPTIILVAANGAFLETFKGEVSEAGVGQVVQAVEKNCGCEPAAGEIEPDVAPAAE